MASLGPSHGTRPTPWSGPLLRLRLVLLLLRIPGCRRYCGVRMYVLFGSGVREHIVTTYPPATRNRLRLRRMRTMLLRIVLLLLRQTIMFRFVVVVCNVPPFHGPSVRPPCTPGHDHGTGYSWCSSYSS